MAGVTFSVEPIGFERAFKAVDALGEFHLVDLADEIGVLIENSTKRRITDEKAGPDGQAWAAWSEAYDETRNHGQHSLLVGEGDLRDSIQSFTTGSDVTVGTNLVYGAIHQFGGGEVGKPGLPARPYLGLSDLDRADISTLVTGRIEELMQ